MSRTKTDIVNMALAHLGINVSIADLDKDRSQEALACRLFYYDHRDNLLRSYPWPFCTSFGTLALVTDFTAVAGAEWRYSYRVPGNVLMVRRVAGFKRTDSRQSRIPYRVMSDSQGELLYTDMQNAEIEFTQKLEEQYFKTDFVQAQALGLAVLVAPKLTAGDPFGLGKRAAALYTVALTAAQANASNEEQPDQNVEAESIRARGYTVGDGRGSAWYPANAANPIE